MFELLLPALIIGILLSTLSAPLGCVMVWRRMSFFADSLAHGSMLGVALAATWALPTWLGACATALMVGFSVWFIQDKKLPADSVLAMVSSVLLCAGVVLTSLNDELHDQLFNLLLGDILLVTFADLYWMTPILLICLGVLLYNWRAQILCALDVELAASNQISNKWQMSIFIVLLAIFCVIGLKAIGSLLISAVLVIPAITARLISHSPQSMAFKAFIISVSCVLIGLLVSTYLNIGTSPAIVITLGIVFLIVYIGQKIIKNWVIKRSTKHLA